MKASELIGKTIAGRYELTSILGEGGMGAVFAAIQQPEGKPVALKVIPASDERAVIRFKREAGVLSGLTHKNTVTIYDYGEADNYLYLAMEILEGLSLDEALRRYRRLSVFDAVHVAQQIAASLTEAHQAGIVHRDIKPANIFLLHGEDDEYIVKVLDFGIAKRFGGELDTQLTKVGTLIGTPRYMSPEQIRTEDLDQRSDIYSLACVLYEMIAGRAPFLSDSVADLLIQHLKNSVPPLSRFVSPDELKHIPPGLDSALNRALSKDPRMRQNSMGEFCKDLEIALAEIDTPQPSPATPLTVSVGGQPPEALQSAERRRPPTKKVSRIKPTWVFSGIIAALVLIVMGLVFFAGGPPKTGDSCSDEGRVICGLSEFGSAAVLGCQQAHYQSLAACAGLCSATDNGASCGPKEPVIAIEGAYCGAPEIMACSEGLEFVMVCEGLAWTATRACGLGKCGGVETDVSCEGDTYGVGDRCDLAPERGVCSTDFKQLLKCEAGKTTIDIDCQKEEAWCTRLSSGDRLEIGCHKFQD